MLPDARRIVAEDLSGAFDQPGPLDSLRNSHVTVTGGTGFVGTWLAEAVAHLNDVHAFGTQITLFSRSVDRFAIEHPHLGIRDDIRLVKGDVRFAPTIPTESNYLIHAAANPDTRAHASRPVETMTTIADGTASVLNAVRNASDLRMIVNLSSAMAAGPQPLDLELLPDDYEGAPSPGLASSSYAEAKRYAETLCAAVRSQDRLPIVTVRPFAFIGPFQSLSTPWAVNAFMSEGLSGGPIRVLGNGRTVRSYLYGSDVAYWLLRIAAAADSGDCINVGSDEGVDLDTVARAIASHLEPEPNIVLNFGGTPAAHETRMVPSVNKAAKLGLAVRVSFAIAIERTLVWNQSRLAKETVT